ncbi:MAG: hypothetical protein LUC24_04630 [Bacteroidales bacterium]|nr:hypothetical protein [Bacteroidales bacterium]
MPISDKTNRSALDAYIVRKIEARRTVILRRLNEAGLRAVNSARNEHGYTDRTGNLTSSIGYVIVEDGKVIQESAFEVVKDGAQGSSDGRAFAESLASGYPTGIVLIIVAGMNYAAYVSARGFNVLDSAETVAEKLISQLRQELR